MTEIVYCNGTSLFDFSNGACKSLNDIFSNLSVSGHKIFVITGCSSSSIDSYKYTLNIWKHHSRDDKSIISRFMFQGIYVSLIKTSHWSRHALTSFEQETIYREYLNVLNRNEKIKLQIGWGNLLLEESVFRESKRYNIKLLFYLVTNGYLNSNAYIMDNCDSVITDSNATKKIFEEKITVPISVMPKFISEPKKDVNKILLPPKICLFVNPAVPKGLEIFLSIASYHEKNKYMTKFICRDAKGCFMGELSKLDIKPNLLPKNIIIKRGTTDTDELFKDIRLVLILSLAHESGTSLIYEAYSRGIPVLAFDNGGNKELLDDCKNDIFPLPDFEREVNNIIKVKKWNSSKMSERINSYMNSDIIFKKRSEEVKMYYKNLNLKEKAISQYNHLFKKLL